MKYEEFKKLLLSAMSDENVRKRLSDVLCDFLYFDKSVKGAVYSAYKEHHCRLVNMTNGVDDFIAKLKEL